MTNALAEQGWDAQATPLEGGLVRNEADGSTVAAPSLTVDSIHRVEGASDPGDMAFVAAVTFPEGGTRATLVVKYGPDATAADSDVLLALPDGPAPRESGASS